MSEFSRIIGQRQPPLLGVPRCGKMCSILLENLIGRERDTCSLAAMRWPSVAGVPFAILEQHAEQVDIDGEPIPVLDLRGLLETKKQSERPKDQADAVLLREALTRLSPDPKADS